MDNSGKVTGLAVGSSDISVTDAESSKTTKLTLSVKTVGAIAFQPAVTYNVPNASELIVGDFDGDGNVDVIVGGATEVGILYGKPDGTLTPYATIYTWGAYIAPCAAADMNGDGKLDFVCVAKTGKVLVFNNAGGRSFAPPIAITVTNNPLQAAVGDFNGDGRVDIATVTDNPGSTASDIRILTNNGGGSFTQTASYRNIWIVSSLTAADLNGDGKLDLIVPTTTDEVGTSGVGIMWGDGTGKFTSGPYFNSATANVTYAVVADFNGDGKPDILVDDYFDNNISVVYGNGGGSFMQASTYFANGYPLGISAADFDGDGAPDLVAANAGSSNVTVIRNANGLFPNPKTFGTGGSNTRYLQTADFNKDGKPDIVASSETSKTISILLNNAQ